MTRRTLENTICQSGRLVTLNFKETIKNVMPLHTEAVQSRIFWKSRKVHAVKYFIHVKIKKQHRDVLIKFHILISFILVHRIVFFKHIFVFTSILYWLILWCILPAKLHPHESGLAAYFFIPFVIENVHLTSVVPWLLFCCCTLLHKPLCKNIYHVCGL